MVYDKNIDMLIGLIIFINKNYYTFTDLSEKGNKMLINSGFFILKLKKNIKLIS